MSNVNIVSEQHDINQIKIDLPDFDGNVQREIEALEGRIAWDAREYGISREAAIARIQAANTPEARAKVLVDLRQRAINRAGLDTSNGRVNVMVAGEPAWHRLGVNVKEAVNSKDAMKLSGTDFGVSKRSLSYLFAGEYHTQEQAFAIVRDDTGAFLGSVGSRYQPIQNSQAFEFLDSVMGEYGAKYETCGSIFGGRQVWMLVKMPNVLKVGGKDVVEQYALFTNPHDGSGMALCFPTSKRVVCQNTHRVAMQDSDKGIGIRHTGDIKSKIRDAQRALGIAVKDFAEFGKAADAFASQKLNNPRHYFDSVLDVYLDISAADAWKGAEQLVNEMGIISQDEKVAALKRYAKQIEKRSEILVDIAERYASERCGLNGMRGTVWAAFNAVTEFADHSGLLRYKGDDKESRRFESTLYGSEDHLKQAAFQKGLILVA